MYLIYTYLSKSWVLSHSLWAYVWKNNIRFRWFHSIETSQNLLQEVSLTKKLVVGLEFSPCVHRKHSLDLSLKFSIKYSSCQLDIINKLFYSLLRRIMMALKSENENKLNNSEIVMAKHWQGSTQSFLLYSTKILTEFFFLQNHLSFKTSESRYNVSPIFQTILVYVTLYILNVT